MYLTKNQAICALEAGKTIGFKDIKGISIFKSKNHYLFKHIDGKIERLHELTMDDNWFYEVLDDKLEVLVFKLR